MFNPIYERGCLKTQGARVFLYSVSLPDLREYPKISEFYRDIADLVILRCQGELYEQAQREYLSLSERERQTVFHPAVYSLMGEATYFDGEIIIIKLTATLKIPMKKQHRQVFEVHAWSLDDGLLIPPRTVARKFIPKGRLPRMTGDCGFLVEGEKFYLCRGGSLSELSVTKKETVKKI